MAAFSVITNPLDLEDPNVSTEKIAVCLGVDPDYEAYAIALSRRRVRYVKVRVSADLNNVSSRSDPAHSFFAAIGSLPTLQCLELLGDTRGRRGYFPLSASLLTTLLQQPNCKLRRLIIKRLSLTPEDELSELANTIQTAWSLENLSLSIWVPGSFWSPLMHGLGGLPNLESLDIATDIHYYWIHGVYGKLQGVDKCLGPSNSLKTFILKRVAMHDDNECRLFTEALHDNRTLKKIFFKEMTWNKELANGLARMLQVNTCLETLDIIFSKASPDDHNSFSLQVARSLGSNSDSALTHYYQAHEMNSDTVKAFAKVLESNVVLTTVRDPTCGIDSNSRVWSQVDYYLRLNRAGRSRVIKGNLSPNEWIDFLGTVSDNVGFLYYYLSQDPLLWCGQPAKHGPVAAIPSRKRKLASGLDIDESEP